jgi:asparagine synthase (glutamine-hydrolysing)
MTDIITHRGPDEDGHWLGDGVGLGMRRLSIIDLSGGQQPITNEDGSVLVVFNGEIYNYRELRADLERAGHHFATNSDTETIVHAYEEDGLDFPRRLHGMFAIALWDRKRQRLVLVRDRFGKKPLYYAHDGQRFIFGSEMKSLLLAPNLPRDLDPHAIGEYFTFGYISSPRSALASVAKLPAAHTLTFEQGRVDLRRYWSLDFTPRSPDDAEAAARRVRELVLAAVRKRLISEVPLGAFLSGGVDSSIVVAAMSQVGTERVKTFSIGFEEESHSELEYARLVAQRYDTDHHEFIVRPDLLDVLPRLVWTFDEPFADASMVPTYYVSKMARQHVTVALSGDGGDELYGGYRRYTRAMDDIRLARKLGPMRPLASVAGAVMPEGMKGKNRLSSLASDPAEHYVELLSIFPSHVRSRLLLPEYRFSGADDPRQVQLRHFADAHDLDFYTRMQHTDVQGYLTEDILMKVDKASMATSLEARAPLLDHELAEYVASLRHEVRNPGEQKKYILKKAMADLLPEQTLTRSKMGFSLPVDGWLRGPLRDLAWDTLTSQRAANRGVLDPHEVRRLLDAQRSEARNNGSRIWAMLCFELWCRAYLDGDGIAQPATLATTVGAHGVRPSASA